MTSFLYLLAFIVLNCNDAKPNYCVPSNKDCWPTQSEINDFSSSLDGNLIQPSSNEYQIYVNMTQDTLYRYQYPSFFVICLSAKDIQSSVSFASLHNIQISICSTGHSYSGRNTANISLQINLSKMTKYQIANDNNSITVETGL